MSKQSSPASTPIFSNSRNAWLRVLLAGFSLYIISIVLVVVTGNPNLFPTMILLGNFLVPITFVAYLYERQHISSIKLPQLAVSFFLGGVLSVFAAGFLEPLIIRGSKLDFAIALKVGLIEELAKIVAVMFVARKMRHNSQLDGLLLGAAVGMGFAALESTGYAFTVFLEAFTKNFATHTPEIFSLLATISVTALRSLLAPFGHGVWTAILAAVLFRQSGARNFRIDLPVLLTYGVVTLLHGLWDGGSNLVLDYPVVNLLPIRFWVVIVLDFVILSFLWKQAIRHAALVNDTSIERDHSCNNRRT
ncbi:MAG: PrsW family intramembrane metalloprotease [Plectolyngbya sp. WJT66-NPBG17]|jgi:RsiW-degrading membrane proteinase PrsW (M82 family)|nr:PrsW family intramembrane metalloprotease [Plectolyngbya sp. WJT66-NPBG17]